MSASKGVKVIKTVGTRIAGVVSCVPEKKIENSYFYQQFGEDGVEAVSKMTGVRVRHWTSPQETTVDLCNRSAAHLINGLGWDVDSVDAVIFVSQTPDYRLPASACLMQDKLGLRTSVVAFDVNLGCSGYPYALWLGSALIQSGSVNRVILAVGDTISKLVDPLDRSTAMLFGDAGTVTALERTDSESSEMTFILGTDGSGARNLCVPEGGARTGSRTDSRFADKDLNKLFMDGGEIFNFTLKSVPPLVESVLLGAGKNIADYDAFLFHQANAFMLNHLAKKAKLPAPKVLKNIERFGNTSCASIPLLLTTTLGQRLVAESLCLAMFGFGVGYSWGGVSLKGGPMGFVDHIEL